MNIYEIHPVNLDILMGKLADMQKRAKKLKTNPISIEKLGVKIIEVSRVMPGGKIVTFTEERILMKIHGETPKLAGWSLVAKIEWLEGERLISCVPGEECPEKYRTGDFTCDHCGTNRQRKEVFILRHDEGNHVQVGRTCIRDFLGGKSPQALLAEAEFIFRAEGEVRECSEGGGFYTPTSVGTIEYLCSVAVCIRRFGWLPKSACRFDGVSTSSDAWNLALPVIRNEADRDAYTQWVIDNNLQYQDRDKSQAEAALAWAKELPTTGVADYLYNLGVACRAGYVTFKTQGLVASAIAAHLRHLEREEEITQRRRDDSTKSREWVGEVKKREVFPQLTVLRMQYIEGQYGTTTLITFESPEGNLLKWFASKDVDELKKGDVVTMKATVKKHDEWKDVKQTVINRAVVVKTHEVTA